jgi:transcription initiation factor IIE alpha subunit
MKIIENPNPREEKIKVCPKCQCKFTFNNNDTHSWNNGVLGPGYSGDYWVNCPNCGEHISLIEKQSNYEKINDVLISNVFKKFWKQNDS